MHNNVVQFENSKERRLEALIESVKTLNETIAKLQSSMDEAKQDLSDTVEKLLEVTDGEKSILYGGKWYWIRKRNGRYFVTKMDKKPGSWRKK